MSPPDPQEQRPRVPRWTAGSIALLAIGLLVIVTSGLCSASVIYMDSGPYRFGTAAMIIGGISMTIGAAIVDAARYHRGTSSGVFSRIVLLVSGLLIAIQGAMLAVRASTFGLVEAAIGISLLAIGFSTTRKRDRLTSCRLPNHRRQKSRIGPC
jgi:hypothetical protein